MDVVVWVVDKVYNVDTVDVVLWVVNIVDGLDVFLWAFLDNDRNFMLAFRDTRELIVIRINIDT